MERQGSISPSTISRNGSHVHSPPEAGSRPLSVLSPVISEASRPPARQMLCPSYLTNLKMWLRTFCSRCPSSCQQSFQWSAEPKGRARRHRVRSRKARPCFATGWAAKDIISLKSASRAKHTINPRSPCECAIVLARAGRTASCTIHSLPLRPTILLGVGPPLSSLHPKSGTPP